MDNRIVFANKSFDRRYNQTKMCIALSALFIALYLEPLVFFGLKFSHLYKLISVYFLTLSILIHRKHGYFDRSEGNYRPLIYAAYLWAMHPIVFSFTRDPITNSMFIGGQRLFSVLLFHWILHKQFKVTTLVRFYQLFMVFAALTGLPFLAGILKPLGKAYDLSVISGTASQAFIGVFQNSHGASTVLSMTGVSAFALSLTSTQKTIKIYFFVLTAAFLAWITLTYTRAGWVAAISGIFTVIWYVNKDRTMSRSFKIWILIFLIAMATIPQVLKHHKTFRMRALGQTKYSKHSAYDLNEVSSGRLLIWKTSGKIFLNANFLEKLAGIGEEELRNRMYRKIGKAIYSHNGFINQLLVDGIIGLYFLLALVFYIYRFFSSLQSEKYRVMCMSTFVCWLTHFFFQGGEFPVANALLFLLTAIALFSKNKRVKRELLDLQELQPQV